MLLDVQLRYLERQHDVDQDGMCAVVTAGPPGAGKSTAVATLRPGFRVIDPDAIKDLLIERALVDGTYRRLLDLELPDGRCIQPRELSGLVHAESTMIADDLMQRAARLRENVVVEGTLRYWPHALKMLDLFEESGYGNLTILSCDVPEDVAQARALDRWWSARTDDRDGLGGRFVPRDVISDLFTKTVDRSDCALNAREYFDLAAGTIPEVYLRVQDLSGVTEQRHIRS